MPQKGVESPVISVSVLLSDFLVFKRNVNLCLFLFYRKMLLWLLILLPAAASAQNFSCPALYPFSTNCYQNSLFVLDATDYLTNSDINNEVNFAWNNLLPQLSFPSQQATFIAFGTGADFTPLTSIYGIACSTLSNLALDVNSHGGQRVTLTSTMNQIYQDYPSFIGPNFKIVLFSGSTDGNDISSAGTFVRTYMRNVQVTVIALSNNRQIWNGFPYTYFYTNVLNPYLGNCLMANSCGIDGCSSTVQPTTTTSPAPSTTTPSPNGPQCQCDYGTSWNDVMFLVENSYFVGNIGVQELLGYIQTSLAYFNVERAGNNSTPYHTRIGIITYSDTARVVNPLGSLSSDDLMNIQQLPYMGTQGTNLNLAFEYATNELFGYNARFNARPVIVVLGTTIASGNYTLPQAAADSFRRAGGVVIVYDYSQPLSPINPLLQNLTSSGYFIVNTQDNGHRLQDALCDANCKCSSSSQSFSGSWDTGKPTSGCFTAVETLGNYQVATNKCALLGGIVAQGKTAEQTAYIESLFSGPASFLAGMKWDSFSGIYRWVDGSAVTGPYQPWYQNSTHQSGRDCVYVYNISGQLQWVPTDCRNGFFYSCQGAPCDSTNYCS